MKKKRTVKSKRNRLDGMIASGKTLDERKRILALQRIKPLTPIQNLVNKWQVVRLYRDNPEKRFAKLDTFQRQRRNEAEKVAFEFIRDVFDYWDINALRALAQEMKRPSSPKLPALDLNRWRLLHGENISKIAREVVEKVNQNAPNSEANKRTREKQFASTKRGLQKIKAKWGETDKQKNTQVKKPMDGWTMNTPEVTDKPKTAP